MSNIVLTATERVLRENLAKVADAVNAGDMRLWQVVNSYPSTGHDEYSSHFPEYTLKQLERAPEQPQGVLIAQVPNTYSGLYASTYEDWNRIALMEDYGKHLVSLPCALGVVLNHDLEWSGDFCLLDDIVKLASYPVYNEFGYSDWACEQQQQQWVDEDLPDFVTELEQRTRMTRVTLYGTEVWENLVANDALVWSSMPSDQFEEWAGDRTCYVSDEQREEYLDRLAKLVGWAR